MWQECQVYSLDEHRFLTNDEVEAAREAAYKDQVHRVEEAKRK